MATNTSKFKMTTAQRLRRHFSESFKIKKVRELETGITRLREICQQYEVSDAAVYSWIKKYGIMKDKPERVVIESESDTQELLALRKKVAELERVVGQKQLLIDFKDKMIELAESHYQVDIKKKFSTKPSSTTGKRESK